MARDVATIAAVTADVGAYPLRTRRIAIDTLVVLVRLLYFEEL